jgi:segregation and condensation protein A
MVTKYEIDDVIFSGPVWLLYSKASSLEIDLLKMSLSSVARDFISYIGSSQAEIEEYSEFIFYLSMILLLKSEEVLPRPQKIEDEDTPLPIVLPLERELFKKIALQFREMNYSSSLIGRIAGIEETLSSSDSDFNIDLNLDEIAIVYKNVCDRFIESNVGGPVPMKLLIKRVEEEMNTIVPRLNKNRPLLFRDLVSGYLSRTDVIVAFLAILELFRIGVINLRQAHVFGDIEILLMKKDG